MKVLVVLFSIWSVCCVYGYNFINNGWIKSVFGSSNSALQHRPRKQQEAALYVAPPPIVNGIPIADEIKNLYNNMKGDCVLLPIYALKKSNYVTEYCQKKKVHYSDVDKIIDDTLNRTVNAAKLDEILYGLFKLHYHKLSATKNRNKINLERFFFSLQDEIQGRSVIPVQDIKQSSVVQSILSAKTMTFQEIDDLIDSHVPCELTWNQFLAVKTALDRLKLSATVFTSKSLHTVNKDLTIAQIKQISVTAKPFDDCDPTDNQINTCIDLILGKGAASGDPKRLVSAADVGKVMDLLRYEVFLNYGRQHTMTLSTTAEKRNTTERLGRVDQYRHIFRKHSNGRSISVDAFLSSHHLKRITSGDVHTKGLVSELVKQIHTPWKRRIDFDEYVVLSLLIDDNEKVSQQQGKRRRELMNSFEESSVSSTTVGVSIGGSAAEITPHDLMKWQNIQEAIKSKMVSVKQLNRMFEMVLGKDWDPHEPMNQQQLKMVMGLIHMFIARSVLTDEV